jgi:flagellar basal-body rod protein FlgG
MTLMERGLYAAASGMIAQQNIQDTLAQNIANANTVGYKQDNTTFRALQGIKLQRLEQGQSRGAQVGELGLGVAADKTYTNWQRGAVAQTNVPLDASLDDPQQFFTVSTARGEPYTRAGNFQVDAKGNLLSGAGQPVVSSAGQPINTGGRADVTLDSRGNVMLQGRAIAQLKIVQIAPNALRKDGETLFAPATASAVQTALQPSVRPGTLEQSNVNTVRSLVQMIDASRGFDMAQRAITTQDDMLKHAQSDLGKL